MQSLFSDGGDSEGKISPYATSSDADVPWRSHRLVRMVFCLLLKAYSVASNHIEHIQLGSHESIAPAMVRWVTRLIEQGLGSKQVGFDPRICVTSCVQVAGCEIVALPMHTETSAAVADNEYTFSICCHNGLP